MIIAPFTRTSFVNQVAPEGIRRIPRSELPNRYPTTWEHRETNRRYKLKKLGRVYSEFVEDNLAEVHLDKMTFVVTKPGFYYRPHLAKKTDNYWDTIVFTKPGRYSIVSVNKTIKLTCWGFFRRGVFDHNFVAAMGGNIELLNTSFLATSIPATEKTREEFLNSDYGKELAKKLGEILAGEVVVEEIPEGILKIDGFIPLFCTYDYNDETDKRSDECFAIIDDKFQKYLPFKVEEKYSYHLYQLFNNILYISYPNFGDAQTPLCVAFYGNGQIVYTEELMDKLYDFFSKNKKPLKTRIESLGLVRELFGQDKPGDFRNKFNKYMADRGLGGFTADEVIAGIQHGFWTKHDYEEDLYQNIYTVDTGYYVNISYNGSRVLGPNSKFNGWLFVTEDGDKIRLVHSAWCQHISAWSSYSASVTDQKYSQWCIADWLSGPWAEKFGLKVKEAPSIFMGNVFRSSGGKKKTAIQELRERMQARLAPDTDDDGWGE